MATTVSSSITNASNILTNSVSAALSGIQNNAAAITSTSFSNLAPTDILNGGVVAEVKSPQLPNGGYFYTAGSQTTPGLSRGALVNTALLNNNNNLSHVCDFKFDVAASIGLGGLTNPFTEIGNAIKNGKMAAANAVRAMLQQLQQGFRTGLAGLLEALNLDPTGQISLAISAGKYIVRILKEVLAQAAQIAYDVAFILALPQQLNQIIKWIESLPSQIKAILEQCLTNFNNSLKQTNNSIKNIPGIKQTFSNLSNSANSAASQVNTTNSSLTNIINGSTNGSDVTGLTNHINQTVAAAPPSFGATANTASQP